MKKSSNDKTKAALIFILGVLLLLPLLGVSALGTVTQGVLAWVLALVVLIIGIIRLSEAFS